MAATYQCKGTMPRGCTVFFMRAKTILKLIVLRFVGFIEAAFTICSSGLSVFHSLFGHASKYLPFYLTSIPLFPNF